jgi:serine kinase of HPr protein (carbohydrate metabolism regulator)
MTATIHATALLFGHRGILIRGPSGSGKSRLALSLLQSAGGAFARLVGDDRIRLEAVHGRILMRPATALAGLIEIHGLGVVRVPSEPVAVAHVAVDLNAADAARLPDPAALSVEIGGVRLARLPVAAGAQAAPLLLAFLRHSAAATGLPEA